MTSAANLLTTDNPVFSAYIFYVALLTIKMLLMAPLTAKQRFRKHVFANPEDAAMSSKSKVKYDDPDVERVRRAHLNDLENIPLFFVIALAYVMTDPPLHLALNLFRSFVAGRFLHTLVYAVFVIPQPSRGIAWFLAYGVTWYMAIMVLIKFM